MASETDVDPQGVEQLPSRQAPENRLPIAVPSNPLVRNLIELLIFEAAFFVAYRYAMTFSYATSSPFWFPDSVLLCALLRMRPRWWWVPLLATLPIRLLDDVGHGAPTWFLLSVFLNDSAKAVLVAVLLRKLLADPFRFSSLRDFGIFCAVAVLGVPFISAFAGAAARAGVGHPFWLSFEQWFLGNAMASLIVTPFLFYWVMRLPGLRAISARRWAEIALVIAGLIVSLFLAFKPESSNLGFTDWRFYAPLVFIIVATVRFGMFGATAALAMLTLFAVRAALTGEGPFGDMSAEDTAENLQRFLLLRAVPLLLVAVLVEQERRANEKLRDSEMLFREIANSAPALIWMAGADAKSTFQNKSWLDFTGRRSEQELGDGWAQNVHPDDRQRSYEAFKTCFDARQVFEMDFRVRRFDGEYRWIISHGVPRYAANGEFAGYVGSAVDVTDRRRNEASLRASEERYRDVVDSQTEFVCRLLPDSTLTFVNEAYCRFLGKPRETLLGTPLLALLPQETRDLAHRSVEQAIAQGVPSSWEFELVHPDTGARSWQHWSCRAIGATADSAQELQAIGHDITDRKRAEEAHRRLAHAARLAAVGELTAMVAHEINQPLTAILSNAEAAEIMLRSEHPPLDQLREIIADIRADDLRADEVIRSVRALSSKRELDLKPVDLNQTVMHALRLAAGDALHRRVRVARDLDASLPMVSADAPYIEQVLLNLIGNAMDAMKATPEASRELRVETRLEGSEHVLLIVHDRGHGIPVDIAKQLFDSFFTTKSEGMGIGLSMARSIITAHHGRIWAENRAGGGASVGFTLCVSPAV